MYGERVAAGVVDLDRMVGTGGGDVFASVRVTLPDRVVGGGYTITVTNATEPSERPAQPFTYTITLSASSADVRERVSVRTHHEVVLNSTSGGPVVVTYANTTPDATGEISIRTSPPNADPAPADPDPEPEPSLEPAAVYVDAGTGTLSSLRDGGTVGTYSTDDVGVIGPKTANLDGDERLEVPYVTTDSRLKMTDADGDTQTLVDGGPAKDAARLAVGTWNGSDASVFYTNDGTDRIYRVRPGGSPTLVVDGDGDGDGIRSVGGIGDVDGDGDDELVYIDDSATLTYYDGGYTEIGQTVGVNNGVGVGDPADFDGDGTARVPIVDTSNNLELVDSDGNSVELASGNAKSPIGAVDVDADDDVEVVFLDSDGTILYVDDVTGSNTIRQLRTESNTTVAGHTGQGVV